MVKQFDGLFGDRMRGFAAATATILRKSLWLVLLLLGWASAAQAAIPASERTVLTNLYASTNGASWNTNTGWMGAAGTECTWFGILCDATQSHVTYIGLWQNNLVGTLPSLSGLTALQYFLVDNNQLTGSIPSLSGLTALQGFFVDHNQLIGSIPPLVGLTALQDFYVGNNQLTGSIPSLSGLTALQGFGVNYNQLTGSIPSLSGLTALQSFDVRSNQLSGPIPAAPSSLVAGSSYLCGNSLVTSGNPTIDAAWVAAQSIDATYDGVAAGNWLACQSVAQTGIRVSERAVLTNLYASTNGASWTNNTGWMGAAGTECSWYGVYCDVAQRRVTRIVLDQNNLVGTLPSLSGLTALKIFSVSDNQLTGSIPSLSVLPTLQQFYVNNNQLTGSIPPLSGLTALQAFIVDNNQLTGSIPSLSGLMSLQYFYVANNQLTGSIPSLSGLTALQYLSVNNNQLTGPVPAAPISLLGATLCSNSLVSSGNPTIDAAWGADWQACQTSSTGIPASERQVLLNLYASTNGAGWINKTNWNGAAGTECSWSGVTCDAAQNHVTHLELMYFNLAGNLPSLSGLTALQYSNLSNNQLTGSIPSLSGLAALRFFEAYNNKLTGSIPSLSGLSALEWFDVSGNQLSGSIPSLSGLAALWYFNASNNQLTGAIPSLSGLTVLNSFLALNNQLTGSVPAAPTSLGAGNSNLCGNSLVSSGTPAIDAAWVAAQNADTAAIYGGVAGGNWLACQTVAVQTPVCTLTATPATISVVGSSTLTASCTPAATSYTWTGGTCTGTSAASCTVAPAATTTYTVKGVNSGGTGNTASATVTVTGTTGTQTGIPASERQVLLDLYASTNGAGWTINTGWNGAAGTECNWYGVYCYNNNRSHVTGINLESNHLVGILPSLSGLTALDHFYAFDNQLSGSIPSLSGLTALEHFRVWNNQLSGSIPSLSGLTALTHFEVSNNQLTGSVPAAPSLLVAGQSGLWGNSLVSSGDPAIDAAWVTATGSNWLAYQTVAISAPVHGVNTDSVQRLYLAYFNRPADPAGLAAFEALLSPTVAATQAQLTTLAGNFNSSAEYAALYAGQTNAQIIDSLYMNLFGRHCESTVVQNTWAGWLTDGTYTFSQIALQLTYSAQGTDATAIANKLAAATAFTTALDTNVKIAGYSGTAAAARVRAWLATVTDVAATLTAATASVDAVVASNVTPLGSPVIGTDSAGILAIRRANSASYKAATQVAQPGTIGTATTTTSGAAAYNADAVQRLYVAYFNRPADPAGLAAFEALLIPTVAANQAQLVALASNFSSSAEYAALYAGQSNAQIIDSLYMNLSGHIATPADRDYWVGQLASGAQTFAEIALQLAYSAQGADATAVANKLVAATAFTTALDTSSKIAGYSGTAAAARVRAWLATVTNDAATLAAAVASVATVASPL